MDGSMIGGRMMWVPDPKPKPVSASRWVPLAQKHGMWIDFANRCVDHVPTQANVFWGDAFDAQDVGAAVVAVAKMVDIRQKGNTP